MRDNKFRAYYNNSIMGRTVYSNFPITLILYGKEIILDDLQGMIIPHLTERSMEKSRYIEKYWGVFEEVCIYDTKYKAVQYKYEEEDD